MFWEAANEALTCFTVVRHNKAVPVLGRSSLVLVLLTCNEVAGLTTVGLIKEVKDISNMPTIGKGCNSVRHLVLNMYFLNIFQSRQNCLMQISQLIQAQNSA